jgi:hypothetical protein
MEKGEKKIGEVVKRIFIARALRTTVLQLFIGSRSIMDLHLTHHFPTHSYAFVILGLMRNTGMMNGR